VQRVGLLDLLRVALHCGIRYFRNFAGYWLFTWRDYRRQFNALRCPRGRNGVVGLAHRLRRMARESWGPGAFHLGECHDRLQMRRGAVPRQHATTKALRFSWRSWKFLGEHGFLLQTPQRDKYDVVVSRRHRARA